jgi:hypothetical protein
MTLPLSERIAVRRRSFLRLLLSLNADGSRTIFSRSSMSSVGRSAERKALTVTETSSASVDSGTAVATTWGMAQR